MSNSQQGGFSPEKTSRTYNLLSFALLLLAAGIGVMHYMLMDSQRVLAGVKGLAARQYALTQRIGLLTAQYQNKGGISTLGHLKDGATAALAGQDAVALWLSSVPKVPLADGSAVSGEELFAELRAFTDRALMYAVAPQGADPQTILSVSIDTLPAQWEAVTAALFAGLQAKVTLFSTAVFILCGLTLCLLAYEGASLVRPALRQLALQKQQIEQAAATDMLTGTYNRAMLFRVANMLISSSKRHKQDLAVIALDIDGLKKINDDFGRATGDGAIRTVAKTVAALLRTSDAVGRVGGGEFAIFLPSTDEYHASFVAEKLRAAVEDVPFNLKDRVILLRASIGIVAMAEHHKTPDDLLLSAESVLRHAKAAGGNKVMTHGAVTKAGESSHPGESRDPHAV